MRRAYKKRGGGAGPTVMTGETMRVLVVGEAAGWMGGLQVALHTEASATSPVLRQVDEVTTQDWVWLRELPSRRALVLDEAVARTPALDALCAAAAECAPPVPVIVIGDAGFPDEIIRWFQAGVAACLPWPSSVARVRSVFDLAFSGGRFVPDEALSALLVLWRQEALGEALPLSRLPVFPLGGDKATQLAESALLGISQRQYEILALLSRGLSIKTICQQLVISEGTAKTHVSALYRRLGARNRGEAIYIAAQRGARHLFET
ncbi:helix-turn-helix transcriptional regulator [Pandoraea nosoerga]|uniref:Helix-turn-helix transcriptional regulator n=2 Tax=Burkholderiaceae TaxID=119060 RepID=A0A5E4XA16_9BURK|nr:helix-turn-helix transcriptional regulator [Pandoraea nosoerga]